MFTLIIMQTFMVDLNKITLLLYQKDEGLGSMQRHGGCRRKKKKIPVIQFRNNYSITLWPLLVLLRNIDTLIVTPLQVIHLYSLATLCFSPCLWCSVVFLEFPTILINGYLKELISDPLGIHVIHYNCVLAWLIFPGM